jgi:hypothetical protein
MKQRGVENIMRSNALIREWVKSGVTADDVRKIVESKRDDWHRITSVAYYSEIVNELIEDKKNPINRGESGGLIKKTRGNYASKSNRNQHRDQNYENITAPGAEWLLDDKDERRDEEN